MLTLSSDAWNEIFNAALAYMNISAGTAVLSQAPQIVDNISGSDFDLIVNVNETDSENSNPISDSDADSKSTGRSEA